MAPRNAKELYEAMFGDAPEPVRASERAAGTRRRQRWEPLHPVPHAAPRGAPPATRTRARQQRTPVASEEEAVDPELRVEPQPSLDSLSVATSSTLANLEELHLDWSLSSEAWEFLEQQPCSPSDFGISDADME